MLINHLNHLNKKNLELIKNELNVLKKDLKNNTTNCNKRYHKWLEENRHKILPKEYKHSYLFDIKHNPQKYLKHMIYINIELEKNNEITQILNLFGSIYNPKDIFNKLHSIDNQQGMLKTKLYQFFPLRSSGRPKYCTFDSKALVDIFIKGNKIE